MFHVSTIKNWFRGRADAFNRIAEFLNNLSGVGPVVVERPTDPSSGTPPTISIDVDRLASELNAAPTSNENLPECEGGDSQALLPDGLELDQTQWVRGKTVKRTKGQDGKWADYSEDGRTFLTGVRMMVVSRVVRAYDTDYFFWRWAYLDRNGSVYRLSAEQGVFAEVNYDTYAQS